MSFVTAISIAASGLSAERTRLNVASMNLANAHVTRTIDGGPYRARSVIFASAPHRPDSEASFGAYLLPAVFPVDGESGSDLEEVRVAGIVEDPAPFREVYDPGHPDADEKGIVRLPNVNVMEQMVDIMTAARAYEANLTAIETAKAMALKTIEIGK